MAGLQEACLGPLWVVDPCSPTRPAFAAQVFWEKQLDTKCCVGWNEDTVGGARSL